MNQVIDRPIIVALDYPSADAAKAMVQQLNPQRCRLKIGKELFTRSGPQLVKDLQNEGFDIFLDLKYHDIPNTVAAACRAAAELNVWMVNVHAFGGRKMMQAAADAVKSVGSDTHLIAVTVLTSMGEQDLHELGIQQSPAEQVQRLAQLTQESGLDGVVCSPKEISLLRKQLGDDFLLVTPGIRPEWSARGDQQRVTTPREAIELGSSYLVIGRPITAAEDPLKALDMIEQEINA